MIDVKFLRENIDFVAQRLATRGGDIDLEIFVRLDRELRLIMRQTEEMKARRNAESEEIGRLKKRGVDAAKRMEAVRKLGATIRANDERIKALEKEVDDFLLLLPNIPHPSVPVGPDEKTNQVIREWGVKPAFDFPPLPHWELGEMLGILDLDRAARMAGARFSVTLGVGALMERALISFMLDLHTREHGYREVITPFLVNRESMVGTGQIPKFEEDLFHVEDGQYYLIPTAEVPVTNLHRGEILKEGQLPISYASASPCFRREAGSHGKDTRGLIRLHQFNKVELVKFCRPKDSDSEFESLTGHAEEVLKRLGIHYRLVVLSTGDLGFAAVKTYDLDVWLPAQATFREISSCSNFEDFQARRAGIRFRPQGEKGTRFVHTINGSGVAVGRCFAAILENFQQSDGSVIVPEVLRSYMGGLEKIQRDPQQ